MQHCCSKVATTRCCVNLVSASGGYTPLPRSLSLTHTHTHTGAKESMPKCSWQLAVVCHFVAVRKFYCACRCCCLPAAGTVWKFVAKSVYWFAMCNSHSMKIELFLWLLIGLGSREGGVGFQCAHAERLLHLMLRNLAHMLPVLAH